MVSTTAIQQCTLATPHRGSDVREYAYAYLYPARCALSSACRPAGAGQAGRIKRNRGSVRCWSDDAAVAGSDGLTDHRASEQGAESTA